MRSKSADQMRKAFSAFLERRGIKAHNVARTAGIASSTIYNFLNGTSDSLSASVLQKIADSQNTTVDELLGGEAAAGLVPLKYAIGVYGKMFEQEKVVMVKRPPGLTGSEKLVAAEVSGDGMHPIASGWRLFFREKTESPERLVGKLCVVRIAGADQPMVREIRRGTTPGLYNLQSWNAGVIENADVLAAHLVVSMTQAAG